MARFVSHVTLADRSVVAPGKEVVKTWCLRNDSDEPWPAPVELALVGGSGEEMGSPVFVPIEGGLNPGDEREISINLVTPTRTGLYEAFWRLREQSGRKFGQRVWCILQVASA